MPMTAIHHDATTARGAVERTRARRDPHHARWPIVRRALICVGLTAAVAASGALPRNVGAQAQAQPAGPTAVPTKAPPPKFTNSKATLAPGAMMVITWRNLPNPSGSDMAALYPVGAQLDEFITWAYMATCRQSLRVPGAGWATASCTLQVPNPIMPGNYEWRILRTLSFQQRHEIWRFPAFAVTAPSKPNGKPYDTAITTKSSTIVGGELLTVQWKDIADPTLGDWIGLFDADDESYLLPLVAQPTSCNLEVPREIEAGTCSLGVPFDAVPGTYEVRLFTVADGLNQLLATSSPIEVGAPPPDATPPNPMFSLRATPTPKAKSAYEQAPAAP
jgi:hypothetical protein